MAVKRSQTLTVKRISEGYSQKPIKVTNVKQARRLLSKLIYGLQTGEVTGDNARTLTYLLISFVNIFKQYEFERRLNSLEQKLK